jgi:hypothetical protein
MFSGLVYIFVYYSVMIHIPALATNYIDSPHYIARGKQTSQAIEREISKHNPNPIPNSTDVKSQSPQYLKVPTNVTAVEGADVILSCRIDSLNDQMVFWIRNSDLQILTAGLLTFSSDPRFRVNHENSVDEMDWSLLISDVRHEDQGMYECQINTEPKMKLNVNLVVKGEQECIRTTHLSLTYLANCQNAGGMVTTHIFTNIF